MPVRTLHDASLTLHHDDSRAVICRGQLPCDKANQSFRHLRFKDHDRGNLLRGLAQRLLDFLHPGVYLSLALLVDLNHLGPIGLGLNRVIAHEHLQRRCASGVVEPPRGVDKGRDVVGYRLHREFTSITADGEKLADTLRQHGPTAVHQSNSVHNDAPVVSNQGH